MTILRQGPIIKLLLILFLVLVGGCGVGDKQNPPLQTKIPVSDPLSERSGDIPPAKDHLAVTFLDVGQADCTLVQLPNGETMLVDAGNNEDGAEIVSYIKQQGIKKIDYLIATHPHEDHIGGMDQVVKEFLVGRVFMPRVTTTTRTFEDLLLAIKSKGLKITAAHSGITMVNEEGLKVSLVAPIGQGYEDLNDYSVVTRISYKDTAFLLTGDVGAESEDEIIKSGVNLKADVLKVSHHGSRHSSSLGFLQKVAPQYAVISVGEGNNYGHPHRETLKELTRKNIKIYRTDQDGLIEFHSDGNQVSFCKPSTGIKQVEAVDSERPPEGQQKEAGTKESGYGYIGNKRSKKFHRPSCHLLPAPHNRIIIEDREEALAKGFTPCQECRP